MILTDQNLGNFLVTGYNNTILNRTLNSIINIDCEFLKQSDNNSFSYFLIPIDSIINLFIYNNNGVNPIPNNSYCQLMIDNIRNNDILILTFLDKISSFKDIFHEIDYESELPRVKSVIKKRKMFKRQKNID